MRWLEWLGAAVAIGAGYGWGRRTRTGRATRGASGRTPFASPSDIDPAVRDTFDELRSPAMVLDPEGRLIFANRSLRQLAGDGRRGPVEGDWFDRFVSEGQREQARSAFRDVIRGPAQSSLQELTLDTEQGERKLLAWEWSRLRGVGDQPAGVAALAFDITEQRRIEERLRHETMYDSVTGLPNRTLFVDRLQGCIARARRRSGYRFAVVQLSLDRFKVIRDGLGFDAGNQLVREVGRRIHGCTRPGDSVARIGGDEFGILIDDAADPNAAQRVVARIQTELAKIFHMADQEVFLSASIGTVLSRPRYETAEEYLRDAETAMHHAKAQGAGGDELFDTNMHTQALMQLQLENDLHRAMDKHELRVHYQPIVSISSGTVVAFEALVRWERANGIFVPPSEFIRIAEETGVIVPIGRWVLEEACRQTRRWQSDGARPESPLSVSVNLSTRQFAEPDLVEQIIGVTRDAELDPGTLKLEITESILMQDPEVATRMLTELDSNDVHVCIDDFGTGYSSLSYLMRLPAKWLKIDRSFVENLVTGSQPAEMVRMIIALARSLNMDVIAEGVESPEQMQQLRELGCDYVQGYLISRPVSADIAESLLRTGMRIDGA